MALVVCVSGEEKARKSSFRADRKPWMLKDYLVGDDMSSCSSNGFRSFPRRQCCAAVRNIIENNKNHSKPPKRMLVRNRSFSSALQRASMAVINAVKLLPFNSPTSGKCGDGKRLLSRTFSKKLFRRSFFWKKEKDVVVAKKMKKKKVAVDDHGEFDDEIERWISSGVVGKEKYQPLDLSNDTNVTNVSTTSISNSDGKSDSSWSDITFSSDSLRSSSENDVVERKEEEDVGVGVTAGVDSVIPAVAEESMWFNDEAEKERSSPISVLDFPYSDEGGSSPFTLRVSRLQGTKERLMKKLGRFECLAGLEPVNLESLISSTDIEDRSPKHVIQPCSTPSYILSSSSEDEDEDEEDDFEEEESQESEVERHAQYLLNVTKANIPSKNYKIELENVILDYFRENVTQKANYILLKAVEDWINGHYEKLILGWEVKDKRQAYIKDMEEGGWWARDTKLEREEVSDSLGDEVLAHLIEELMVEFCSL